MGVTATYGTIRKKLFARMMQLWSNYPDLGLDPQDTWGYGFLVCRGCHEISPIMWPDGFPVWALRCTYCGMGEGVLVNEKNFKTLNDRWPT